jgi:hypothetical protein
MHPRRLQLGALSIALAGSLLLGGNASAELRRLARAERFYGWTPLSDYVSAGLSEGGSFRITLPTRAGETEVELRPVDVHGAAYHAEEAASGGARRGRRRAEVRTFAGTIERSGASAAARKSGRGADFARLSLEPGGRVSGLLRVDGVLYDLDADTAAGDLVLQVQEVDVHELGEALGSCGAAVDEMLAGVEAPSATAGEPDADAAAGAPMTGAAATVLREIELGTEADAPFVSQTGGVDEANARIVSMVNAINGIYEFDLGLTNKIVFQRAWNLSDPYTTTNSDTLLNQFRSNFSTFVATPTDDAVLFSGRDFENNVVGRAYVSAACSSYRFGVNQFYQQSDSLTRLIVAHEMGHNFGGNHTPDGIMAPSINPSVTWFSATSQNQIGDYVGSVSCLSQVEQGGPPEIEPIGPQSVSENTTLALQLEATDPDGDPVNWAVLPLPIGASLTTGGFFQWKPDLDAVGCGGTSDHTVTFYARDPDGNQATETVVISVLDAPTGSPPEIADPADRSAPAGRLLSIPLSASDVDGDSVSFEAVSLPAGATLSPAGTLAWTPTEAQLGAHVLSFAATDCTGENSVENVAIEVVSGLPHLTSLSAASGGQGDQLTLYGQNLLGKKVRVYFGTKKAKAYSVTDTSLVVQVPKKKAALPDALTISVLRDKVASDNSLPFTYVAPTP